MPYADVALYFSATRPIGGKIVAAGSVGWGGGQLREGLNYFVYLFTFCNVPNAGILVNIFHFSQLCVFWF